jgi:malonyl-CoA O-methyltransferase
MTVDKNMVISPDGYSEAAVIAHEVSDGLWSRLEWMTLQPKVILNMACKTGRMTQALQTKYPDALILSMDSDEAMLQYAHHHSPEHLFLCAQSAQLPIRSHSVDLIVANLLLPWCVDASAWMQEAKRLLRQDGMLILTTFGPESFAGLSTTMVYHEMHELGDAIVQAGLMDPVLDTDHYTFSYREMQKLNHELMASGVLANPEMNLDRLQVSFEVVYAHAFAGSEQLTASADQDGAAHFPLSYLRQQLRGGHHK